MRDDERRDDQRPDVSPDPASEQHTAAPADAALQQALSQLPRAAAPSAALEQRVVHGLQQRGLLEAGAVAPVRVRRAAGPFPRWAVVTAIAASVALLLSGYAIGHRVGSQETAALLRESQKQSAEAAVRQAGTTYVAALAALADRRAQGGGTVAAGVEAQARVAFMAAADQMVRLFPDDPLSARILRGLEHREPGASGTQPADSTAVARHVVWF